MSKKKPWWGAFTFKLAEVKCWRIGDRVIAIKRGEHEWTVWNKETALEVDAPIAVGKLKADEHFFELATQRYMLKKTESVLTIEPSLADRAVIVQPNKPFFVAPKEEITIFVSTPLWMTVLIAGQELPILDIPFWRPSDTWFGPSTMKGDLCYSKYTDAKVNVDQLEIRAHRASTMVKIKNGQKEPLLIERLNLPVQALKLYRSESNELWTDQISILQITEQSKPISYVKHSPPENIESMELVSQSRELSEKSSFLSSVKNLIG